MPRHVILHVTAALDYGGVETHLRLLATYCAPRFEHHFCAINRGGTEARTIEAVGKQVYVLDVDPWRKPLVAGAALLRLMHKVQPDVVHGHGLEGNLFGLPMAWISGVPIRIGEEIGIPNHSIAARTIMWTVYKMAHRVIGVSEAVRGWLIASGEVSEAKAIRLCNPVEMSDLRASPRSPTSPLKIAFLGRLEPVKNVPALVKAIQILSSDAALELHIIGDGSQRAEIEQLVIELGLGDRVFLHGKNSSPDILLATCHLYVQPSLGEGFGIALVEAMSCGLPAVVSGTGGMAEIVEHERTGWIIPSTDPKSIAKTVAEAVNLDPMRLAQMGDLAREAVRKKFSVDRYVHELERFYEECGLGRDPTTLRKSSAVQTPTNRGKSPQP